MPEPIPGDDFVNETIDNEGTIIAEPTPGRVTPRATVGTIQNSTGSPLQVGDVATVLSAEEGPVPVIIISLSTPLDPSKRYYKVMTRELNGQIGTRAGMGISQEEFSKHFQQSVQQPATGQVPVATGQVPAAPGQVPAAPGQVPTTPAAPGALPPLPPGWSQRTTPEGQVYYFNATTGKSSFVHPAMRDQADLQTTGTELADLLQDTWSQLTESEIQPLAFRYMMYTMTIGLCIGSIFRIGWCRIPGLNQSYCTYITLILFSVGILILAALSYAREPDDATLDMFEYWQTWVMIASGGLAMVVMVMFNLRTSGVTAYGDFGGSSGMAGMPGMAPGMTGYY